MIVNGHGKGLGEVMLWGCMTMQGIGYACRIDGKMDAELYTKILDDEFLSTLEYYGISYSNVIFQQDNEPKPTTCLATKWFASKDIEVLQWPPQSPDLNPIEHLWQHLKRKLSSYETEPISITDLWNRVETEWNLIPPQVCLNMIESMPRRVAAVLKSKGSHTKY